MRLRLGIPLFASVLLACGISSVATGPLDEPVPVEADASTPPPVSCTVASDCPKPTNDCVVPKCEGNTCGTTSIAAGTSCASTGGKTCDGKGACAACLAATDCAVWLTKCAQSACTSGKCAAVNVATGGTCDDNGGRLCDGSGTCVACVTPGDCPAQPTVCKISTCPSKACGSTPAAKGKSCTDNGGVVCDGNGNCVAVHCTDVVQDADETDVDCGGSCGATCKDTGPQQKCLVAGDCISGVCKGLCQVPTCTDGVKNGNETDIDCGGASFNGAAKCPACADTKKCANNTDCVNNACFGAAPGTCVSCGDGLKDGNETDIDCGGPLCDAQGKTCGTNKACTVAADCTSGYCPANTCQLRPNGTACTLPAQCLNASCEAVAAGGSVCCNAACTDQGAASCGMNGQCAANGSACTLYASGTTCPGTTCTGNTLKPKACNGTGTCALGANVICAGHLKCNGGQTACLAGCGANSAAGDNNCTSGFWCDGVGVGVCQAAQSAGKTCTRNSQCTNGCNGSGKCR